MNESAALPRWLTVSRETRDRLDRYVALLQRWQRSHNLIAAADVDAIWSRHIADSAQLVPLFPKARRWVDLGSGAGLPGLVVAILLADTDGSRVDLIESDLTKAAFLRTAIRETGAPAAVHAVRVENAGETWAEPAEIVTARALAPLPRLCALAKPFLDRGAIAAFHKGRDFAREIDEASLHWSLDLVEHPSRTSHGAVILEIRGLEPRARQ